MQTLDFQSCLLSHFLQSSEVSSVYFLHSHSCLSPLEIPTYSQNSSHKYPMPLDFQFKEPQLLTEFQKAACGIGVDIFWNHQTHQHKAIKNETDN